MIIVTDLDGTLLNSNTEISGVNTETFQKLGNGGHIRIIATGRNYYSVKKCVPFDFPIDYLIFSSGAGLMNWETKEILQSYNLTASEVKQSFKILIEKRLDFAILYKVPDNHKFEYIQRNDHNTDFERRNSLYGEFAIKTEIERFKPRESCQLIAIDPGEDAVNNYNEIKEKLANLKVIRSTSPLDGKTLWIEIYSSKVSKSKGIEYISAMLGYSKKDIMVVGNDYNDLDMLRWSDNSYVVSNSTPELKKEFRVVGSNDEHGFSMAVNDWLSSKQA